MNATVGKAVKGHLFKLPCSKVDHQEEVTIVPIIKLSIMESIVYSHTQKSKLINLHLMVLLGIFLPIPFANAICPYLYWKLSPNKELLREQAWNIINFQFVISCLFYVALTCIWIFFIGLLSAQQIPNYILITYPACFYLLVGIVYPVCIAIYLRAGKPVRLFYPNISRLFK